MREMKIVDTLAGISAHQWNALVGEYPFLRHEFLSALQETGCASPSTGWKPCYLTLWSGKELAGAMPLFLKSHSRGEFVFDHAWAAAFERHGIPYYPKLVCAAPFSPVAGPRLLAQSPEDRRTLVEAAIQWAEELGVSSLHVLFPSESDAAVLRGLGFMLREGIQFHWTNDDYAGFSDFLASLNHDKRKKIQRERRRVREAGVSYRWIHGRETGERHWKFFHRCYLNTYREHWSSPYLNLDFFRRIGETMADNLVLIMAMRGDEPVACALNVLGEAVLYGRYWGTVEFVSGLHFETCYCQAIEYGIRHGISRFEGGAQGLHKMSRGLMPTATWSAHWIADARFADAIERFLSEETREIEHYLEELETHSPFKKNDTNGDTGSRTHLK